jgi:hypothetical protein
MASSLRIPISNVEGVMGIKMSILGKYHNNS